MPTILALEAHGNVHGDAIQFCVAITLAVTLTVGEKHTGSTWFVLAVLVAAAVAVGAVGLGEEWYYGKRETRRRASLWSCLED